MSEKSIRWFCPTCNDFVSIRKTEELKEKVMQVKRLPYPIIIKHGNPPHYTILQLDRDLRDRGRLTTTDYLDLTHKEISEPEGKSTEPIDKRKLEQISGDLSDIQRKIWHLLDK
ncbi:MAG: hypothetical protein ACTSRE_02790 [Promethearchaeota archaeon]